jgi:hypothetical protein
VCKTAQFGLSAIDASFHSILLFAFVGLVRCACAAPAYLRIPTMLCRVSVFVVFKTLNNIAIPGEDFDVVYLII